MSAKSDEKRRERCERFVGERIGLMSEVDDLLRFVEAECERERERERRRCRDLAAKGAFNIGCTAPESVGVVARTRACIAAGIKNGRAWASDPTDEEPWWDMSGKPRNAAAILEGGRP